jgi:hypothetical protein
MKMAEFDEGNEVEALYKRLGLTGAGAPIAEDTLILKVTREDIKAVGTRGAIEIGIEQAARDLAIRLVGDLPKWHEEKKKFEFDFSDARLAVAIENGERPNTIDLTMSYEERTYRARVEVWP